MNTFEHTMKHVFLSYTFHVAYLSLVFNVPYINIIISFLINGQDQLLYVYQTYEAPFEVHL